MNAPTSQKYLLAYRSTPEKEARQPSPEEMQQMLSQWYAWKARYTDEILDLGDALKPSGKVLRASSTSDGPFLEAKEVLGGYSILQAASLERAIEIARGCPVLLEPGASVEVREMAGY